MASLLCVKQYGGSVKIHDKNFLDELSIPRNNNSSLDLSHEKRHSDEYVTYEGTVDETETPQIKLSRKDVDHQLFVDHALKQQKWLSSKIIREVHDKSNYDKTVRDLYSPILQTEYTFVKDVDAMLAESEMLSLRKKELLHKRWSDQVFQPLRGKILTQMHSHSWRELDRRKREMHRQYLEFVNRKGHVFLDTIDPSDYYAMSLSGVRPSSMQVQLRQRLRDPLLSQDSQRNDEERMILKCSTGNRYTDNDIAQVKLPPLPLVPLGRHGTECATWLAMPLHNIESSERHASRRRMCETYNASQLDFGAWQRAPFDSAVIDEELKMPKKRLFRNHIGMTSSAHLAMRFDHTPSPLPPVEMVDKATTTINNSPIRTPPTSENNMLVITDSNTDNMQTICNTMEAS